MSGSPPQRSMWPTVKIPFMKITILLFRFSHVHKPLLIWSFTLCGSSPTGSFGSRLRTSETSDASVLNHRRFWAPPFPPHSTTAVSQPHKNGESKHTHITVITVSCYKCAILVSVIDFLSHRVYRWNWITGMFMWGKAQRRRGSVLSGVSGSHWGAWSMPPADHGDECMQVYFHTVNGNLGILFTTCRMRGA